MGEIIVRERMFIPAQYLDERKVKKRYVHRFYDEAACRRCKNRPERHNYLCNKCKFYGGKNVTYNEKMIDGDLYYGLPMGDRAKIEDVFGLDFDDFEIEDLRTRAKRRFKVKMVNFTPYSYQEPAVVELKKAKYGILKAPPRSGKTPTMLYTGVTQFPYRIAIIADQREFLNQFLDHVREFTNLPDLEEKTGKKLYGYGKKPEDFKNFEIIVCTYQTFLSNKGKKLLKLLNKNYGTVFVDEVHSAGALRYSEVLNDLWAKVRIGATGTDSRKDGKIKLLKQIIGDVTALIDIPQMTANVYVHPMPFVKTKAAYRGKAGFSRCINFLSAHKERNDFILEWIMKDLEKGHSIVIPVYSREHVWELVKRINDEFGKTIAGGFVGGGANKAQKAARADVLEKAKSGKIRVVVGIRSLMQRGLNVPRWTMLYNIMPINNEPNWKQESSRILTPMEGKRQPAIRFFVDENIGMPLGCFVGTYKQTLKFKHKPTEVAHERALALMDKHGAGKRGGGDFMEDTKAVRDRTIVRKPGKGLFSA